MGFFSAFIFIACNKEEYEETYSNNQINFSITRSVTDDPSWDQCERCISSTGDSISLPWSSTAICSIPTEIREDVKIENGWRLLYSSVSIIGCTHQVDYQYGANYIILYNKYTGMLKGFYYASSIEANNSAFWLLTIPQTNTKLFNFTNKIATPYNESATNQIVLSNISESGLVNGFSLGWNCFMVELAYDENSLNEELNISAFALNQSTYTFNGEYQSTSTGHIVSQSSGFSTIFSGLVSGLNSTGVSWLNSKISTLSNDGKPIKIGATAINLLQNLTSSTFPSLINVGINKVFGSLLGQATSTSYSLQFTTEGKITLTGTQVTPCVGYIYPISGIPFNGIGERLGVWNLAERPKFQVKKDPQLISAEDIPNVGRILRYRVTETPQRGNVVINPDINAQVSTTYSIVKYNRYQDGLSTFLDTSPTSISVTPIIEHSTLLYSGGESEIYTMPCTYDVLVNDAMPNKATSSHIPVYDFHNSNYEIRQHVAFKLVTKVTISNDNVAYSCKTFVPINELVHDGSTRPYTWTTNELIRRGYLD